MSRADARRQADDAQRDAAERAAAERKPEPRTYHRSAEIAELRRIVRNMPQGNEKRAFEILIKLTGV